MIIEINFRWERYYDSLYLKFVLVEIFFVQFHAVAKFVALWF